LSNTHCVGSPEVRPLEVSVKTTRFIDSKWNWPNYGEANKTNKILISEKNPYRRSPMKKYFTISTLFMTITEPGHFNA
jgi:hypothetical protein